MAQRDRTGWTPEGLRRFEREQRRQRRDSRLRRGVRSLGRLAPHGWRRPASRRSRGGARPESGAMIEIPRDERGRFLPYAHLIKRKRQKRDYVYRLIPFAIFLGLLFWAKQGAEPLIPGDLDCSAASRSRAGRFCENYDIYRPQVWEPTPEQAFELGMTPPAHGYVCTLIFDTVDGVIVAQLPFDSWGFECQRWELNEPAA